MIATRHLSAMILSIAVACGGSPPPYQERTLPLRSDGEGARGGEDILLPDVGTRGMSEFGRSVHFCASPEKGLYFGYLPGSRRNMKTTACHFKMAAIGLR